MRKQTNTSLKTHHKHVMNYWKLSLCYFESEVCETFANDIHRPLEKHVSGDVKLDI